MVTSSHQTVRRVGLWVLGAAVFLVCVSFADARQIRRPPSKKPMEPRPVEPENPKPWEYREMDIKPGWGTEAYAVGDTASDVRKILGKPSRVRKGSNSVSMIDYRTKYGLDFLVRRKTEAIIEIRFNKGYQGKTTDGIKIGDPMQMVVKKSGGAKKVVEATSDQTHGVELGTDLVLYKQMHKDQVTAYKFIDSERGILYWAGKDKKVTQIVVFKGR